MSTVDAVIAPAQVDEPIRAELFGIERLEQHGESLAAAQRSTEVRQTRWSPLVRPERAFDGRWTTDLWAPLEGRMVNAGVRLKL